MRQYLQGSIVISEVRFRNDVEGIAVDPETVQFYYQPTGSNPSDTLTYTDATEPAVGVIARLGVGWYQTYIDTTNLNGTVGEFWDGLGTNQAPGQKQFQVIARGSFT